MVVGAGLEQGTVHAQHCRGEVAPSRLRDQHAWAHSTFGAAFAVVFFFDWLPPRPKLAMPSSMSFACENTIGGRVQPLTAIAPRAHELREAG